MSINVQMKDEIKDKAFDGESAEASDSTSQDAAEVTAVCEKEEQPEILVEKKPIEKPVEKPFAPLEKRHIFPRLLAAVAVASFCIGLFLGILLRPEPEMPKFEPKAAESVKAEIKSEFPEWITEAYLTVDGVSRTGEKLEAVRDIAVHYVANPGTGAMANRNYFEAPHSDTSAHFIVGLEGEVLILIPTDEKSCATNARNIDTISVEVCHPDESGAFTPKTYESLIRLLAYLCEEFDLSEQNLIRHYDVTGKLCPRYYVEHPSEWQKLKADVKAQMEKGGAYDEAA